MSEEELSQQALYEFTEKYGLQVSNPQIRFRAFVIVQTEKHTIEEVNIRIIKGRL